MGVHWDQSKSIRPHAPSISYSLGSGFRPVGISWESSALPEQTVGEHYIWIDQGGGNYGVQWALLGQIKAIFDLGDHLLILLSVHLLRLLLGGQFSPCRQVTNKLPTIIDIVVTTSEEFRVSIRRVLSVTQECECRAVLKSEIALGDCWYLVPVGIFTGDLLEISPALPTVVTAECGCYLQALVHYESPVAFEQTWSSPAGVQGERT